AGHGILEAGGQGGEIGVAGRTADARLRGRQRGVPAEVRAVDERVRIARIDQPGERYVAAGSRSGEGVDIEAVGVGDDELPVEAHRTARGAQIYGRAAADIHIAADQRVGHSVERHGRTRTKRNEAAARGQTLVQDDDARAVMSAVVVIGIELQIEYA